jgi:hypothetical protein
LISILEGFIFTAPKTSKGDKSLKKNRLLIFVLTIALLLNGVLTACAADVPRLDKDQLKALLGKPELALIDVRSGDDWRDSTQKIAGSIREDPDQVANWMAKYPKDKTLVFYCA